jgi:hypothetical protein
LPSFEKPLVCSQIKLVKATVNINEDLDCDKKDEDVLEEVIPEKTFTIKLISGIYHGISVQRMKFWKVTALVSFPLL